MLMPKAPGLRPFWPEGFSMVVAGMPPIKVVKLPTKFLLGPMSMPDRGLPMTPPLSPFDMGVIVAKL